MYEVSHATVYLITIRTVFPEAEGTNMDQRRNNKIPRHRSPNCRPLKFSGSQRGGLILMVGLINVPGGWAGQYSSPDRRHLLTAGRVIRFYNESRTRIFEHVPSLGDLQSVPFVEFFFSSRLRIHGGKHAAELIPFYMHPPASHFLTSSREYDKWIPDRAFAREFRW